jgi:hypothetical protein
MFTLFGGVTEVGRLDTQIPGKDAWPIMVSGRSQRFSRESGEMQYSTWTLGER